MSKYIVTGSGGFIGKALVAFLTAKGHEVIGIDRKDGTEAAEIGSVMDTADGIAGVFHLAAQTSVFNTDTEQIRKDNIDTFIRVCAECANRGIRLVYASSSTAAPGNATSMYGISKRFDELYARLYHDDAWGVRLHNVYGPDPREGTLLWHLMNDDVVDIYNMGDNKRHFTHIEDAVTGLYQVMIMPPNELSYKTWRVRILNVANPEEMTVADFAREVSARNGCKLRFNGEVRPRDNFRQSVEDGIISLSLHYKTVQAGLDAILGERDGMKIEDVNIGV